VSRFQWRDGAQSSIVVNQLRLETYSVGPSPSQQPTIVLLHEGLGCVALWRDFPDQLAAVTGFGVFAYSRAGYGHSDAVALPRPLDYMTREAEDNLPRLLDNIGFRKGVLLGHSDGASIATVYAGGKQDHRVRGLVLIAPHFFTEPVGLAAIEQTRVAYDTSELRARLAKYHHNVDISFRGWNDAWLHPDFKPWNITESIDYVRVPTLLLQGKQDPYGTAAQLQEFEQRSYAPVDIHLLDECRHTPHVEQPEATLAAVADFCQRLKKIEERVVPLG